MSSRICSIVAGVILLSAAFCPAETKRIVLKNGRVVVGQVVEKTPEGLKVKGKFAVELIRSEDISSVEDVLNPRDAYRKKLAAIKPGDAAGHVALGRWAMDQKMYAEAVERFEAALKIDKANEQAKLLLRLAKARQAAAGGRPDRPSGSGGSGTTIVQRPTFNRKDLIQMEDIYRIRLAELRENERVPIRFKGDVIERFIRAMRGTGDFAEKGFEQRFRRSAPYQQARYVLKTVGRDDPLKDRILVMADPQFMQDFRRGVWRWVATSCASTKCHGAAKGKGKLKLYNFPGSNDQVDYTNFLILDSYHKGGRRMIARDDWERSLLLQYALPRKQAEFRHPEEKMTPPFRSREQAGYKFTLEWIKSLAGPLHPDYGIRKRPKYVMPPAANLPGPRRTPEGTKKPSGKGEPPKRVTPF